MSGERIQTVQMFDCADDAEVILKAAAFLSSKPEHQDIEIWNGGRMVARVPRNELSNGEGNAVERASPLINDPSGGLLHSITFDTVPRLSRQALTASTSKSFIFRRWGIAQAGWPRCTPIAPIF
jgi:hypothetical protein